MSDLETMREARRRMEKMHPLWRAKYCLFRRLIEYELDAQGGDIIKAAAAVVRKKPDIKIAVYAFALDMIEKAKAVHRTD